MEKDKFGYWIYKEDSDEQEIYIKDIKRTKTPLRRLDEDDARIIGKQLIGLAGKIFETSSKNGNKKTYHYLVQNPEKRKKNFYVLVSVQNENIRVNLPSIEFDKKGRYKAPKRTDNPKEILDFNDLTKYFS